MTPTAIVGRILRDNKSLRSRLNLAQLAAAASNEVVSSYSARMAEVVRGKIRGLRS
jgi:hypothetical protein